MTEQRVQICVSILKETRFRLDLEKALQHRPLSELVEEALQAWLDRQRRNRER